MLEHRSREQLEFFLCGSLRDLVPDDHVLARVDRVLDLSWLHGDVAEVYASDVGRPAIDPEAALRLMLAGFLWPGFQSQQLGETPSAGEDRRQPDTTRRSGPP